MQISTIDTARLSLRAWRDSDLDAFASFSADPHTARFVGGVCSREEAWRRMAAYAGHWLLRGYGLWALEEKSSGAFVGYCGLWFPEGWPELELGWSLVRNAQGKGYATEAAAGARNYAYQVVGAKTLISIIDRQNYPSQAVANRLGASYENVFLLRGAEAVIYRHPPLEFLHKNEERRA
jgi:RimJ/RimL family protein N-acetyltransferase